MRKQVTIDGNEAAATVAYKLNEVIAIYPITPSTLLGELCDAWMAVGEKNIWGQVPIVQEMQSEGGAAGACHGALQTGALTTSFTASQGLLLMIPNMFKIAGELTSAVFHITARSIAAQGLSIFGDHSDVMSTRQTGWAIFFSNSVQEAMDFAMIAQASTLEARVPFLHAFDGFRTSHEVMKIEKLTEEDLRAMIDEDLVRAHRLRALTPDRPVIRGTAQNPDVYFQGRETVNKYYQAAPAIVQEQMDKFARLTGRQYRLFDYTGAPDAERIVILMGSGCEVAEEAVRYLAAKGQKVGAIKVRLYRPFSVKHFLSLIPSTVKAIAVLDRTKEPGGVGEPLYEDVVTAFHEGLAAKTAPVKTVPKIIGGRYGLGSKEFTPAMVKAALDELSKPDPKNHFVVGIKDDVTQSSLDYDESFNTEADDTVRAMFWGLGSDGTVGANKNSIKIIGEGTPNYAQGYFVYDSKKSGGVTVSHLRFGKSPIRSSYLIRQANFVAVHQFGFLEKFPVLDAAVPGATVLINSSYGPDEVWDNLPRQVQQQILDKRLKLYTLDGYRVAKETGMGVRINTIMQTGFFALSGVLPKDEAIAAIKTAIQKTYGKRGETVVQKNYAAVDAALAHLHEVKMSGKVTSSIEMTAPVPLNAPEFVRSVTAEMIAGRGDDLPVSAMPADGTFPSGTTQYEKRNIAQEAPVWDPNLCIQCGKCSIVCPHAVIRSKIYEESCLAKAPKTFKTVPARFKEFPDKRFTLQVSVEDCTGCRVCAEACPVKDKSNVARKAINMAPQLPMRKDEKANWEFFQTLPEVPKTGELSFDNIKNIQLLEPLFEFSGACAGCGETPYLKLLSQLFGDRMIVANATGCSSIYGGNLPTTPWAKNHQGRGPAWSNSLFEDNAEFGMGYRLTIDQLRRYAVDLATKLKDKIGQTLVDEIVAADQGDEAKIQEQRNRVEQLKLKLSGSAEPLVKDLLTIADYLVKKSVWAIGGDGWAYDIGYGGLDHVLACGHNVNVLVLDTEVYSNTGGQASKATSRGAVAKFAAGGKNRPKKDLGRMMMTYGNVYVAQVAIGGNETQTIKAFLEAEAYEGPSIVIANCHCIAHGIDMAKGMQQQKMAVESGYWPLYRFNPMLIEEGKNPFSLDSKEPTLLLKDYIYTETRYRMLQQSDPAAADRLLKFAEEDAINRWKIYEQMATSFPKLDVAGQQFSDKDSQSLLKPATTHSS